MRGKCCFCPKTVEETPLFRINKKGRGMPGVFACRECIYLSDSAPPDAEVEEIASLLAILEDGFQND